MKTEGMYSWTGAKFGDDYDDAVEPEGWRWRFWKSEKNYLNRPVIREAKPWIDLMVVALREITEGKNMLSQEQVNELGSGPTQSYITQKLYHWCYNSILSKDCGMRGSWANYFHEQSLQSLFFFLTLGSDFLICRKHTLNICW